jgi:hypothetical protein
MDKTIILNAILEQLGAELSRQEAANKQAASGATDSESKAESKWDTQGLEASYLARGYAMQFAALVEQAETLRQFEAGDFSGKPAAVGALLKCDFDGFASYVFLLPACGGTELRIDGEEVTVVTLESPLGQAVSGKLAGDAFALPNGSNGTIISIE